MTSTAGGSGTQLSSLLSTAATATNIAATTPAKDHYNNNLLLSRVAGSGQLRTSRSPSDTRSSEQST